MDSLNDAWVFAPCGFPHSEIRGSMDICSFPRLIAACHVLHRRLVPRHSPCALSNLTYSPISLLDCYGSFSSNYPTHFMKRFFLKTRVLSFQCLLVLSTRLQDLKKICLSSLCLVNLVFVCSFQGTTRELSLSGVGIEPTWWRQGGSNP